MDNIQKQFCLFSTFFDSVYGSCVIELIILGLLYLVYHNYQLVQDLVALFHHHLSY